MTQNVIPIGMQPADDKVVEERRDNGDNEDHSTRRIESPSAFDWDNPDLTLLEDRRGELPDFPIDVFTPAWQRWLLRAAHGAGVRPEHVAVPLLGVSSSLIGNARRVSASRPWSEPMTLWTCVVADSGDRKTPGLNVTMRALNLIAKNNSAATSAKHLAHATRAQMAKEATRKWKEDRQAALDAKPRREPPPMPIDAIDPVNSSSRNSMRLIQPSNAWRLCFGQGRAA
jgi:Protein of unknown function (DUF3987)